jgi:hypothetical protein
VRDDPLFARHFEGDRACPECVLNGYPLPHIDCPDRPAGLLHAEHGPAAVGHRPVSACDSCGQDGFG